MNDKKHIDRLFQEKFKDFEAEPPEIIWNNLEEILTCKNRRRVIPLWFRLSQIAAILVIGAIVYSTFSNDNRSQEVELVNETTIDRNLNDAPPLQSDREDVGNDGPGKNGTEVVVSSEGFEDSENSASAQSSSLTRKTTRNVTAPSEPQNSSYTQKSNRAAVATTNERSADAQTGTEVNGLGNSADTNDHNTIKPSSSEKAIAGRETAPSGNQVANEKSRSDNTDLNSEKTQQLIAAESGSFENKLDTAAIANAVPNALEELLKENEKEEKIAVTNLDRWQVTSSVAPIYFSSASNGSPIDGAFAQNDKSYEKNLSIGVGVNYAVNKKLSVRTGINRFTLGYNTNDVVFFAGLNSNNFDNITPTVNGSHIAIMSEGEAKAGLMPFEAGISNLNQGSISQRMGYIEVPIEMSYKLVDNRFGMTLIGGLSTLFLNENSVSVVSSEISASLGKANNLNDIHFSSNIGLGFNYKIWKSFQFNFEPMFKYQINTFTKDAGNFKPYFIGLYSGFSYNF